MTSQNNDLAVLIHEAKIGVPESVAGAYVFYLTSLLTLGYVVYLSGVCYGIMLWPALWLGGLALSVLWPALAPFAKTSTDERNGFVAPTVHFEANIQRLLDYCRCSAYRC